MTCLAVSGCAHCLALPERLRRICFIGFRPEGAKRTRGPSCAAAARPGIRRMFLPAGMQAIFFCLRSGSGAVAESSPICTNRLFETGQLRRKRHGSARRLAQLDEPKPICTGRTKRRSKAVFFCTGRGTFSFAKTKENVGRIPAPKRCPPALVPARMLSKREAHLPTLVKCAFSKRIGKRGPLPKSGPVLVP